MKLKKATKNGVKLRIGLSGASGFGKTYSALMMAYGIISERKMKAQTFMLTWVDSMFFL